MARWLETQDDDEKELLRFLGNRIPSNPLTKQQTIVPELQKLVGLLGERPGYVVKEICLGGHDILLGRERSEDSTGVKRRRVELRETCRVFFHRSWPEDKVWDLQDSMALFVSLTSTLSSRGEAPQFLIIVLPGKVATRATNAGFSPRETRRILPLAIEEIKALDMSIEGRRRAPKAVDAEVVADALNCKLADLVDLPLLSVEDPAILWDLDMLIGSYVHCPPSHLSYRVVASALED